MPNASGITETVLQLVSRCLVLAAVVGWKIPDSQHSALVMEASTPNKPAKNEQMTAHKETLTPKGSATTIACLDHVFHVCWHLTVCIMILRRAESTLPSFEERVLESLTPYRNPESSLCWSLDP